jgi:CRP/FNR family cyclic AMP-dependent transcriptional regulator
VKNEYDNREFIAASKWFQGAPAAVLDTLAAAASVKHYPANSHLWMMGQTPTELYGVLSGRVRVYQSTETGQEYALVEWGHDAWLGEQALANDEPNMLNVQVLADADIMTIPRKVLWEVGASWPGLYQNLFREGWTNTRGLYEILSSVLFYPLKARLAGRVLQLMEEHGERTEDGTLITIKISQNDFARLSMGSRQRVNAIFRDWAKQGLVEPRDDHLLIRDIRGLTAELVPFE